MKKILVPSDILYLIISAMQLSAGVVANGFIVGLNCIDWVKCRTLTPYGMILTSLAFSRFCLQLFLSFIIFLYKFDPDIFYIFQTPNLFLIIWIFMNQVSLCFASCLSVFYCVKIATFNLSVFNWLKPRLSKLVPWLLLGSLLHSLITTVVFTFVNYFFEITSLNFTDHPSRNITITDKRKNLANTVFLIHSIGSGFPLSLFIASSGLLILSLWKHIRKINLNSDFNPSFRNPSMEAHVRAIKSVLSFLFLYIMYFAVSTVTIGTLSYFADEWKIIMFNFGVAAYPSVHSIILILGNPKLKQVSAKILHSVNCCFREVAS